MKATATEVKKRLGFFMDEAQKEPVVIEKSGRPYVVILSHGEYERLLLAEDTCWALRAKRAEKESED